MTPGARISAAIDVLDQMFAGASAEPSLTRWARGARYAGSKDRAAVRDHVFQALRCRRSYAALGGGDTGRAVMLGAARAQGIDPALLFSGEGHSPAVLSAAELARGRSDLTAADAADLPDWLWSVFEADLGAEAAAAAEAQKHRAPIALRVNLAKGSRAQAIEKLAALGIVACISDGVPTGLIVTAGERKIRQSPPFLSGEIELQDISSQAAMARVQIPAGARVLDVCAGGGGKTLALAAAQPKGADVRFFAHDINPDRMVDLPARAARAGAQVTCLAPEDVLGALGFDVVLCDVPCSGSGTWRRCPDAKWRLTPDRLNSLMEIQRDILQSSCEKLRPDGQLIYTTCSVLTRENEAQVQWLAHTRDDMEISDHMRWPVRPEGDGFYFAAFTRKN